MNAGIPEFTDTYSDDMIFLQTARLSLLRHPLEFHPPFVVDATLARLYAVMLVGNVENFIAQEAKRTSDPRLAVYLGVKCANTEKVTALSEYLEDRLGGAVDAAVLEEYLAIKYLRNAIIHSDRREGSQAEYLTSHGIPLDSRKLSLEHLHRFAQVDQAMIEYLGMARILEAHNIKSSAPRSIGLPSSRIATDEAVTAPYSVGEFIRIHVSNLDKVGASWMSILAEKDGLPSPDLVQQYRALSAEGSGVTRVREWGRSAEYSWNEIVRLWPDDSARRLVKDQEYRVELLRRVRLVAKEEAFPVAQLPSSYYTYFWREVKVNDDSDGSGDDKYRRLFGGTSSLTGSQLLECYAVGSVAYDLAGGITANWLWPLLAQNDHPKTIEMATTFIDLKEVAHTWYAAIERHEGFNAATLDAYRRGIDASTV